VRVTGYAYPWDVLEAPGFLDRVTRAEIDEVAVALSYHSARAATPWSRRRTSVFARHAALYRPVREEAWRGARLRPAAPDWAGSDDTAGDAVRALNAAGVPAAAWIVLTHNSMLGSEFGELAVCNAFGEVYPWALCPAHPEVRSFAGTLTAESLRGLQLSSVILEACGQLGVVHQHQHEKTDGVWAPATTRLLSVCCRTACAAGWAESGLDPDEVRSRLRVAVRRLVEHADLSVTADTLPVALKEVLLSARQRATDELRRSVLAQIPAGTRVVLHGAHGSPEHFRG
jgi:hypothetical protein